MLPAIKQEPFSELLPPLRVTATMKQDLELIASQSVARNLSDHIRYALKLYIEANTPITPDEGKEIAPQ